MKMGKYLYIIPVLALLIAACASPVYTQKDDAANMGSYRTYMWVDTKASETDNSARTMSYTDIPVRNAVNTELKNRGWQEVSADPDALVSYDILVERAIEQKSDPVYSQPFTRSYYNPYTRRWSTIYYPSQFLGYQTYEQPVKEGTITISILDAKTDKAVWQGWTSGRMNYTRFTAEEISRNVKNIFKKF